MKKGTLIYKFLITSFFILFFILFSDDFLFLVLGQELNELPITVDYKPADRGKKPGRGQDNDDSSGFRGDEDSFVLIIPKNDFGQTYNEYPTFWFYFPYSSANFNFKLTNTNLSTDKEELVYSKKIKCQVNNEPGIFYFELPSTQLPLKEGEIYKWELTWLNYKGKPHISHQGVIETVSSDHHFNLEEKGFSEQIQILSQGKWYDLFSTLTQKVKENPEDKELTQLWFNLLKDEDIELSDLSQELENQNQQRNIGNNIQPCSLIN